MYIETLNSTNDYLKMHSDVDAVRTDFQIAGRGQMGNGWESERGQNVLMSVRIRHDDLPAQEQWQVCVKASVALWMTVAQYVQDTDKLCIKWPNDLYYGDNKLAGILIEHSLCGTKIESSIVGIGLNVNQQTWVSSAPNPTSIRCITGKEQVVEVIAKEIEDNVRNIGITYADCVRLYRAHLYRRTGFWWWEEREVSTAPTMNGTKTANSFEAEIARITTLGELVVRTREQEEKTYHFKQIKYIL